MTVPEVPRQANALDGNWHFIAMSEKTTAGTVTATLYLDDMAVGGGT